MSTKINQKEYLKKYLTGEASTSLKKKKKKKDSKSSASKSSSVNIIDDDIDMSQYANIDEDNFEKYALGEDAPQIVGVVDDRPPELIAQEDYKKNRKWKVLNETKASDEQQKLKSSPEWGVRKRDDDDFSPRRSPKRANASDRSPSREKPFSSMGVRKRDDDDLSPRRSPKRANASDRSPLRGKSFTSTREYKSGRYKDQTPDASIKRRRNSDASPPRKVKDRSQERRGKNSPSRASPRRRRRSRSRSIRRNRSPVQSPRRRDQNSVRSPPRRRNLTPDASRRGNRNIDNSPPRRRNRSPNRSPPRRGGNSRDNSPQRRRNRSPSPRQRKRSPDASPRRKAPTQTIKSRSSDSPPPTHKKMEKTLDGKRAGLQNASALKEENENFRKREEELFRRMARETSRNAEAVVRDRRTGRVRDLEMESAKEKEKLKKEQERKAVYDRWGKGVKQIEEYKERVTEQSYEQSKPLARYADDKDLDVYLKAQDRDGDPMAEYMRNKAKEQNPGTSKPIYHGTFPDNRFGIRPGYRWDGVDRSSGYEKKWFEVQSRQKATEEEAYRYSTEDM